MPDNQRRVGSGELFPTDEPVSGEALIGRTDDVDAIASSLLGAVNVVLAGPRRSGKTSVARAALEVCRRADAYTRVLPGWVVYANVTDRPRALCSSAG